MEFKDLGLRPELLTALAYKGYSEPTPIQEMAIPAILEGKDILGGSQTGTGKTAAFTLPLLQKLSQKRNPFKYPRALILTPTRELASQVEESVRTYGTELEIPSTVVFGGVGKQPQVRALKNGTDILVATPGRLLDLVMEKKCNLKQVRTLILDEADRMLDMGFIHDIRKIMMLLPHKRQNMLFSATYSKDIKKLAKSLLHNPIMVEVHQENSTAERVAQRAIYVPKSEKRALLSYLIRTHKWQQVLVFTRTKWAANRLARQLGSDGITSAAIHGDKSQTARTTALADFKRNKLTVLVATDIAARGLDISLLPHVINFELPQNPEDYIHRIGRTGRAGEEGEALSLIAEDEKKNLHAIEKLIGLKIPVEVAKSLSKEDMPTHSGKNMSREGHKPRRRPSGKPSEKSSGEKKKRPQGNKAKFSGNRNQRNSKPGKSKSGFRGKKK